jgi:glycosyltransferase involved in cell wall biosynthesis
VIFVVESGTDVRLLDGLASRVQLTVLARVIPGGRAVSQSTSIPVRTAGPGRLAFAWRVLRVLFRTRRYDAVLVQGYALAALAANIAARLRRKPCWMLVCSPIAEYYAARKTAGLPFSGATLAALNLLARLNVWIGQGYVVLSRYLESVVRRHGATRPVHVVPVYGVDRRLFTIGVDRGAARAARGLPPAGHIIFSSSRVAPEKDTTTLIEAFALLVGEGRDVYLLHRSGGYRELIALARAYSVADRVVATDAADPRRDLALDYAASDVCVQASRDEGLGFSVLEALACGTPVVASAVGGLRETVRPDVTGWSVAPGDARALATAIGDALDHPGEARRRALAGAEMVRERFDSEAVFADLVSVLTSGRPG